MACRHSRRRHRRTCPRRGLRFAIFLTAAGLAPLMHLSVCAIEMTSLEQRIPKVERLLAKAETEKSADRGWKTPTA